MPTNKILLMSADYFKRNSVVNLNVDDELVIPQILKAQNMYIERICGSNLYNTLLTQITSGTLEARMTTLLEDYLQPTFVEYTLYTGLLYFNYKITNKAVSKKGSDNSDPSDLNEVNYLRADIRNDAQYLADRATKFLKANLTTYPEYNTGNSDCDDIKPSRKNFFGSIYLKGNDYNNDCNYGLGIGDIL